MSYAQTALATDVTVRPLNDVATNNLDATRVIFLAGDAIPPHEKYEMPTLKGAGGIFMPELRCLPKNSNGMIYQCKFTPLKTVMISDNRSMLEPAAVSAGWSSGYIETVTENGVARQREVKGFIGSDLEAARKGQFVQTESDHIVYQKRYAGQDLKMATERRPGNTIGGVVHIQALIGATDAEIEEVQYFFFPDWYDVVNGLASLPTSIDGVESHIRSRIAAIQTLEPSKQKTYRSIGNDMLKSCTEFRRTGISAIQKDEKSAKVASEKDPDQTVSAISEHLLGQTGVQRKGDLLQGDHNAINKLAEVMLHKENGNTASGMSDAEVALRMRELDLKEREIALQERTSPEGVAESVTRSGYVNTNPPSYVEPESVLTVSSLEPITADEFLVDFDKRAGVITAAPAICGKPTANGECKRELKDGEVTCWQHK